MNIVLYPSWTNCFFAMNESMFNIFLRFHQGDFVYVQRIFSFYIVSNQICWNKKWRKNDFQSCCCCYQNTLSGYERFNSSFGSLLVTFTLFSLLPLLKKILKWIFFLYNGHWYCIHNFDCIWFWKLCLGKTDRQHYERTSSALQVICIL